MILIKGKKPIICLDPGHGGHDSGAIGISGLKESETNFQISKEVMYQLELEGIDSYLTRTDDTFITLSKRSDVREDTTCFISIHCNSFNQPNVSGIETIYPKAGGKHKALANYVQQAIMKYCQGHKDRKIKMSPSSSYPRNLYVLQTARVPSCLVECEFLSNKDQENWLRSEEGQKKVAHAIAQGIKSFLFSLPGGECIEPEKPEDDLKEFMEEQLHINIDEPIESVDNREDDFTDFNNQEEEVC